MSGGEGSRTPVTHTKDKTRQRFSHILEFCIPVRGRGGAPLARSLPLHSDLLTKKTSTDSLTGMGRDRCLPNSVIYDQPLVPSFGRRLFYLDGKYRH